MCLRFQRAIFSSFSFILGVSRGELSPTYIVLLQTMFDVTGQQAIRLDRYHLPGIGTQRIDHGLLV
jgi:hypothetical protein